MGYQEWVIFFGALGLVASGMTLCLVIYQYRILGRLVQDISEIRHHLRSLHERLKQPERELPTQPKEEVRQSPKPPSAPIRPRESDLVAGRPGGGLPRPPRPVAPKHDSPFIERPGVPSTSRPTPPPVSSPSTEVFSAIVVEEGASSQNAPVASSREGETANDSSVAAALRRFWNWIVVG
ncbi:MAG: hypothetical protein D6741_02585, partial [Planctomycetota bacterium]